MMLQGSVFVDNLQSLSACYERVTWLREATSHGAWQDGLREHWRMWQVVFADYPSHNSLRDSESSRYASCEARIMATLRLGAKLPRKLGYPLERFFGDWTDVGVRPDSSALEKDFLPDCTMIITFFNQGFASLYKTRFQ
jgi:hypothetical protein